MGPRTIIVILALALSGCEVSPGRNTVSSGGGSTGSSLGQLYVATPNSILHFRNGESASGDLAPQSIISGANTQLSAPRHLFMDAPDDRLYVPNQGNSSILVFDAISTLNGNAAPTRVIAGDVTELVAPLDVALDPGNNLLYVADGASVLVFSSASTITGNAPPVRTINMGFAIGGLGLDAKNNQLWVSDPGNNTVDRLDGASLQNGPAVIGANIVGADTGLAQPRSLVVDSENRLLVGNSGTPPGVTIYANASSAAGDVLPAANISGSNTTLQSPGQIASSTSVASGEVFVLDTLKASILVFTNFSTNGNVAPARVIGGAATGMTPNAVNGLAVDPTR
jgi:hypothetical protein